MGDWTQNITKWPGLHRLSWAEIGGLYRRMKPILASDEAMNDLLGHICSESAFNFQAKVPESVGTARGLIQWTEVTLRGMYRLTLAQFDSLSQAQQLAMIPRYFDVGKPLWGDHFKLLGLSRNPALIGAPLSHVIYAADSLAAKHNKPFTDSNGAITIASVEKWWANWFLRNIDTGSLPSGQRSDALSTHYELPPVPYGDKLTEPSVAASGGGGGMLVALGGLGALGALGYLLSRKK